MADKIFKELLSNKEHYLKSKKGKDFEDRVAALISNYFTRIFKDDYEKILKQLKNELLTKMDKSFIENDSMINKDSHFIREPYGSQSYPDFLIFYKNRIICIEIKFTENNKPTPFWNSGIPRLSGIYIYGSYGLRDLTFFMGSDIISKEELIKIKKFNEKTDKYFASFNSKELADQKYGFHYYNRKAYQQGAKYNPRAIVNFFNNKYRGTLESNVISQLQLLGKK